MKVNYLSLVTICVVIAISSCKQKPQNPRDEFLRPATIEYTKQDTSNINSLVNQYAQFVKNKNFDAAAEMLYEVRNDSVIPLSAKKRQGFANAYSHMPIYASKVKSFVLRSDKNNQIDILVQIIKSGDIDKETGVTTISLNPVVKGGKWYLTLLDKNAEGVKDVYDPDVKSY